MLKLARFSGPSEMTFWSVQSKNFDRPVSHRASTSCALVLRIFQAHSHTLSYTAVFASIAAPNRRKHHTAEFLTA